MNGLLIFLASSNKYKKLSIIAMIAWLILMLSRANFSLGYIFPLINIGSFIFTVNISRFCNNKLFNKIYSIFSILIWSICIDIICYVIFPQMIFGQSISTYIFNGILFNYKFVIYNLCYVWMLESLSVIVRKIESPNINLIIKKDKTPVALTVLN